MRKWQRTVAWILQLLLAVLFVVQGASKLAGSPNWVARFRAWGYPNHFYVVIGMVELLGGVALLIPRFVTAGALLLGCVMIGAAITHAVHGEPQVVTALVLLALLATTVLLRGWHR